MTISHFRWYKALIGYIFKLIRYIKISGYIKCIRYYVWDVE